MSPLLHYTLPATHTQREVHTYAWLMHALDARTDSATANGERSMAPSSQPGDGEGWLRVAGVPAAATSAAATEAMASTSSALLLYTRGKGSKQHECRRSGVWRNKNVRIIIPDVWGSYRHQWHDRLIPRQNPKQVTQSNLSKS